MHEGGSPCPREPWGHPRGQLVNAGWVFRYPVAARVRGAEGDLGGG